MDERVHITFSQHLNAGETTFQVPVPQQFLDKDRKFGFEFLSLVPDYHSKQAAVYDMDPESEKTIEVENYFTIDFELNSQYYQSNPWEQTENNVPLGEVIKSVNNHFIRNKPIGSIFPLVYIDWYHLDAIGLDNNAARLEFYKERSHSFYGRAFAESTHLADAPETLRQVPGFNGMLFPTNDSASLVEKLRVCIWMAPNTKLAFSNYDLPNILGFADNQLPEKRVNRQVVFVNTSLDLFSNPKCNLEPIMHANIGAKTSKVHVYMIYKAGRSKPGRLVTSLSDMYNSANVAEKYNKEMQRVARSMNFSLQLLFDATQKKFKFIYPGSQLVKLFINVTSQVASQLGFGYTEQILPSMVAQVVENEDKLQEKALALVLDTKMVVVNLEQSASQNNLHFTNALMAVLEPDSLGILTTKRNNMLVVPRVPVSYYNPTLDFVLHRFDELGRPINLEWKVGAHIQGVLSGNV